MPLSFKKLLEILEGEEGKEKKKKKVLEGVGSFCFQYIPANPFSMSSGA